MVQTDTVSDSKRVGGGGLSIWALRRGFRFWQSTGFSSQDHRLDGNRNKSRPISFEVCYAPRHETPSTLDLSPPLVTCPSIAVNPADLEMHFVVDMAGACRGVVRGDRRPQIRVTPRSDTRDHGVNAQVMPCEEIRRVYRSSPPSGSG